MSVIHRVVLSVGLAGLLSAGSVRAADVSWGDFNLITHGVATTIPLGGGSTVDVTVTTGGTMGVSGIDLGPVGIAETGLDYLTLDAFLVFNGGGATSVPTSIVFTNFVPGAHHGRGFIMVAGVSAVSSPIAVSSSLPGAVPSWLQVGTHFSINGGDYDLITWTAASGEFDTNPPTGVGSGGIVVDVGAIDQYTSITISLSQWLADGIYFSFGEQVVAPPIVLSPDIGVDLAGTPVEDQHAVIDDGVHPITPLGIGTLPVGSSVSAYARATNGDALFSLETTLDLGGVVARPGDVVGYDGASHSLEFDASAEGVPHGASVDALAVDGTDLLLSFDVGVELPTGVHAADEDLVRFDGSFFSLMFDGSSEGVPVTLDLDAAHLRITDSVLLLSFDTAGSFSGVSFDDEDVLAFDATGPSWSRHYDGSIAHAALVAADVSAVPEPHVLLQLVAGAGLLLALERNRSRHRHR